MMTLLRCCEMAAFLFATGFQAGLPQNQAPDKYQTLLARLKQGDMTVDFLELRRAYADSTEYTDGPAPDQTEALISAFNKGDFNQAIEHAKKVLELHYLDIEAHQISFLAYREMHIQEEAEFHLRISLGLIKAFFQTGDGKSRETAWEMLSTHEEYVILHVLGLKKDKQTLIQAGKHSFDELEASNPKTGQKVTLYFNIDKPLGYLHRILAK